MSIILKSTTNTIIEVDIAVDLGNLMLKGATEFGGEIATVKLPNKYSNQATLSDRVRSIETDGEKLYVGVGKLNNNTLKHTREHLLEQTLVVIGELYPNATNLKVNLKLGLPYDFYDDDNCINELKAKFPVGKAIKHKIGNKTEVVDRVTEITNVDILVEGYSAFISMLDKLGVKQKVLVIDVGGETIDLCAFKYDYTENEYDYEKAYTIKQGVINLTKEIATNINKSIGADVTGEYIDELLRVGQPLFYANKEYSIGDYVDTIETTVKTIINTIVNEYGKLDNYYVVGVGGGYEVFNAIANQQIKANIELSANDRFYANVLGYLEQ